LVAELDIMVGEEERGGEVSKYDCGGGVIVVVVVVVVVDMSEVGELRAGLEACDVRWGKLAEGALGFTCRR
jgi:hypothetical protein